MKMTRVIVLLLIALIITGALAYLTITAASTRTTTEQFAVNQGTQIQSGYCSDQAWQGASIKNKPTRTAILKRDSEREVGTNMSPSGNAISTEYYSPVEIDVRDTTLFGAEARSNSNTLHARAVSDGNHLKIRTKSRVMNPPSASASVSDPPPADRTITFDSTPHKDIKLNNLTLNRDGSCVQSGRVTATDVQINKKSIISIPRSTASTPTPPAKRKIIIRRSPSSTKNITLTLSYQPTLSGTTTTEVINETSFKCPVVDSANNIQGDTTNTVKKHDTVHDMYTVEDIQIDGVLIQTFHVPADGAPTGSAIKPSVEAMCHNANKICNSPSESGSFAHQDHSTPQTITVSTLQTRDVGSSSDNAMNITAPTVNLSGMTTGINSTSQIKSNLFEMSENSGLGSDVNYFSLMGDKNNALIVANKPTDFSIDNKSGGSMCVDGECMTQDQFDILSGKNHFFLKKSGLLNGHEPPFNQSYTRGINQMSSDVQEHNQRLTMGFKYARYLRIEQTKSARNRYQSNLAFRQVKVYRSNSDGSSENVAIKDKATATQSSTYKDQNDKYNATIPINEDRTDAVLNGNNKWIFNMTKGDAADDDSYQYWELAFNDPVKVTKVKIYDRTDAGFRLNGATVILYGIDPNGSRHIIKRRTINSSDRPIVLDFY